jgi:hypothetical protein
MGAAPIEQINGAMRDVLLRTVFQTCSCERLINLKCNRLKIGITFFNLPIPAAVRSKT